MTEFNRFLSQIEDDLGFNDCNMERDRPYSGQPHTDSGTRGATMIEGITFRDMRDAFIRAVCLCSEPGGALQEEAGKGDKAALCENDVYKCNDLDLIAVAQNLSCEIERLMGIYPNVPRLSVVPEAISVPVSVQGELLRKLLGPES